MKTVILISAVASLLLTVGFFVIGAYATARIASQKREILKTAGKKMYVLFLSSAIAMTALSGSLLTLCVLAGLGVIS